MTARTELNAAQRSDSLADKGRKSMPKEGAA
jgi:hypothetical protein